VTESSSAGTATGGLGRFPAALAILLFYGVLTLWVRERWALGLLQAGAFLLGILWTAGWAFRRLCFRGSYLLLPLAGVLAWGLLQLLLRTTVYRFDTWEAVLFWGTLFVVVFLSLQTLHEDAVRRAFLRALFYFGFAMSVLATTQYFTSGGKVFWLFPSGYPDALGPFVYRNNYAAFIELLLPLAILEALRDRQRALPHSIMAGVMYASVIASASRAGALLATFEVLVVLALALGKRLISRRRLGVATLAILASAVIFTSVFGWRVLLDRLKQPDPFAHRREMLQSSLAMARERPWMGFGLGSFQEVYPAYATFDIGLIVNHAHNDWAEWLTEGGVPFLLFLASVALWSVGPAFRSIWGLGLLSVFLHALVDYPMQRLGLAAWVFLLLGTLAAEERERSRAVRAAAAPTLS
jgi:O-antigen ligase